MLVLSLLGTANLFAQSPIVIQAETMTIDPSVGAPSGNELTMWSNGEARAQILISTQMAYRVEVVARGDAAQGIFPQMNVEIDGINLGIPPSLTNSALNYVLSSIVLGIGQHEVTVAFTNDYYDGIEDRNLYVDSITLFPEASRSRVSLAWDANDPGEMVKNYRVYRREGASYAIVGIVSGTTFDDYGVIDGHTYHYVVTAFSTLESEYSNEVTAVIAADILAPAL